MRTVLSLPIEREGTLPAGFVDDLRFPDALVEALLERYTEPGDAVFDPFAGFGTVLRVAAEMDRIPYGVEYDREKVAYARGRLEPDLREHLRHGDALELSPEEFPGIDCCLTSPPFATADTTVDPLSDYAGEGSYEAYLEDLRSAFAGVSRLLAPGGRILLEVSNLRVDGEVTTLAWDVADALADVLRFEGELVLAWEGEAGEGYEGEGTYGYGYDHSYCLAFDGGA